MNIYLERENNFLQLYFFNHSVNHITVILANFYKQPDVIHKRFQCVVVFAKSKPTFKNHVGKNKYIPRCPQQLREFKGLFSSQVLPVKGTRSFSHQEV